MLGWCQKLPGLITCSDILFKSIMTETQNVAEVLGGDFLSSVTSQARNFMRDQMKVGQKAFFYHSNCKQPGIAGIIQVLEC